MIRIRHLPKNDRTLGWSALLPPRQAKPALRGDIHADVVVIGGGYAGLSAARRLAELDPALEIAVVEADRCGEGASGRNSGFAIDLPHNVGSSSEELAKGKAYMRLSRAGIAALHETVERYGIQCDWSNTGEFHTASSERGRREVLEPTTEELDRLGAHYRWLNREECAARRISSPPSIRRAPCWRTPRR